MQKMDEYITYLLPNNVYPIIQSIDYTYLLLTINIIFLINIYLKIRVLNDDVYEIERIFHKKSKNLKIQLDSDHNFLLKLNEDIGKIEDKFEEQYNLIKSHVSSISDDMELTKEINERKRFAIYEDIESINNAEKKRIENKFEEQYHLIKSIIEDNKKMSDAIYDNIEYINNAEREIASMKEQIKADKAELLDIIESVGDKVEEVYSDLDAVKSSQ
jgi:methyl-accepting chemotaxis protein